MDPFPRQCTYTCTQAILKVLVVHRYSKDNLWTSKEYTDSWFKTPGVCENGIVVMFTKRALIL